MKMEREKRATTTDDDQMEKMSMATYIEVFWFLHLISFQTHLQSLCLVVNISSLTLRCRKSSQKAIHLNHIQLPQFQFVKKTLWVTIWFVFRCFTKRRTNSQIVFGNVVVFLSFPFSD